MIILLKMKHRLSFIVCCLKLQLFNMNRALSSYVRYMKNQQQMANATPVASSVSPAVPVSNVTYQQPAPTTNYQSSPVTNYQQPAPAINYQQTAPPPSYSVVTAPQVTTPSQATMVPQVTMTPQATMAPQVTMTSQVATTPQVAATPQVATNSNNNAFSNRVMAKMAATNARVASASRLMQLQSSAGAYAQQAMPMAMKPIETATLIGRVEQVAKRNNNKQGSMFWVRTAIKGKKYKCTTNFFCKVAVGDSIQAVVEVIRNATVNKSNKKNDDPTKDIAQLRLVQMPYICPATDKDSIIRCLTGIINSKKMKPGFGNTKAHKWFGKLAEQARESENRNKYISDHYRDTSVINSGASTSTETEVKDSVLVSAYLSELAGMWCQTEDTRILDLLVFEGIITEKQVKVILYQWHKDRNIRRLWMFGLYTKEIKSLNMPWEEIYECCITNPYRLVAIKMDKCEEINRIQGKTGTPTQIYCGKIARRIYGNQENRAWVCTPITNMAQEFPDLGNHLQEMVDDYGVKSKFGGLYLDYPYKVEETVSRWLYDLIRMPPIESEDAIFSSKHLSDEQRTAVQGAMENWICVINGGAGSGKTKTIGQILHNLEVKEIRYQVCSFTGKAVSHIRRALRRDNPATMDKLISTASRVPEFDVLIIDETSMVTIELLYRFIMAFEFQFRVVFVGDQNQLQPIGWGALFTELLQTGMVPTFTLTKNYRADVVGIDCGIVDNSRRIIECSLNGQHFMFSNKANFSIVPGDSSQVYDILDVFRKQNHTKNDVTVLCPFNKSLHELNRYFQQVFLPDARSVVDTGYSSFKFHRSPTEWRIGDRVMMMENDYDINIMNGEEGEVTDIDDEQIFVTFEDGAQHGFKLAIPDKEWDNDYSRDRERTCKDIQHAGAMTIHKSQGSEWDYIIVYVPNDSSKGNFLNRNLLYTAITRARKMCIIIGDHLLLETIANRSPSERNENLANRIRELATGQ